MVYLDDYPVTLMGDESAPPLSRIVRAGGKRPDYVDVELLASPSDKKGRIVELDEIIDRAAEPTRPIYLRTIPHDVKPIYTADPGHALSRPDVRAAIAPDPAMPNVDPVIAQLGAKAPRDRDPHRPAKKSDQAEKADKLATAEAEAEQRQEDDRNHEDTLQDEAEAVQEADEDAETQS